MKITKAEWEAFLEDDAHWPNGLCFDEAVFRVAGAEVEELAPDLPDSTVITILDGVVTDAAMNPVRSLLAHARRWRKAQSVRQVVIEVPMDVSDKALQDHLKAIGARITPTSSSGSPS